LLSVSHTVPTHARNAIGAVHVPPGTAMPFGVFCSHVPLADERLLHQSPETHSRSVVHAVVQAPVVVSQMGPGWTPVVHWAFDVHIVQVPVDVQYGSDAGHALVESVPLSPVHAVHVSVGLHAGVDPLHAVEFVPVHWTHAFVVVLQAGVGVLQLVSVAHSSQCPVFDPVPMQTPAMHWFVTVQVPSPSSTPHTLPLRSHAPLMQTRAPLIGVQTPPNGAPVGIGVPFGSCMLHVPTLQ
jgi:hypothetical protein